MPGTPPSILVVEDEASIRVTMSLVLAEFGYLVRNAGEGFSALREIRREVPDIILSDLHMPGMSGFELLAVVRQRFPAIQTIAMSGAFSGTEVPPGIVADAFYAKGGGVGALLQIIQTLLQTEVHVPRSSTAAVPGPLHRDGADYVAEESVAVTCPLCLRSIPLARDDSGELFLETECVFYRCPIHYVMS